MNKYISILLVVVFAAFIQIIRHFDLIKNIVSVHSYGDCKYLDIDILGPEDIIHYKNNVLLVGSGNLAKVFTNGKPELEQQGIYAIEHSNTNFTTKQLKIKDFPKGIALYVHGICVSNDRLFAINHAYAYGGERIEVFQILENLTLIHQHSILMDDYYMGSLNDLIVVGNNRMLISKYIPTPDPKNGRPEASTMDWISSLFYQITKQKKTNVVDCSFNSTERMITPICKELENTKTTMANGMAWDGVDRVWVAENMLKGINEYKLTKDNLIFKRFIELDHQADNIDYDNSTNSLLIGLIPIWHDNIRLDNFLKGNQTLSRSTQFKYISAIGKYDLLHEKFEMLVMGDELNKGATGAVLSGQNLYISSWCDISIMVCKKI